MAILLQSEIKFKLLSIKKLWRMAKTAFVKKAAIVAIGFVQLEEFHD
jgi:hypothetical protein